MTEKATLQAVLDCKMQKNDASADTVGSYLLALAEGVWYEGEGFGGKRPFGNSGWEHEIYQALWENLFYAPDLDDFEDTNLEDDKAAHALVLEALQAAKLVIP